MPASEDPGTERGTDGTTSTQALEPYEPEEEENMIEVSPEESVYFYSTFMPPITRHKYGTLYTWEMCIGLTLFVLNITMQVGLTYVVGQGVLEESNDWRYSLLHVDYMHTQVQEPKAPKADSVSFFGLGMNKYYQYDSWASATNMLHTPSTWDPLGHLLSQAEAGLGFHHPEESIPRTALLQSQQEQQLVHRRSFRPHHEHHVYNLDVSLPKDELVFHLRHTNGKPIGRKPKKGGGGGADLDGPLCYGLPGHGSNYSCLPKSALYVPYWEKLDTNGDGMWSYDEAIKDEFNLEKITGVKPKLVFTTVAHGLSDRAKVDKNITIPPSMTELKSIPKPYFDYWMGDAVLCSFADSQMCGTLISRGFFDGAMNPAHNGKGVSDLDSAMDYCRFMLKEGGGCDQSMPQIYQLFRAKRKEQCQDISLFPSGTYSNPYDKDESMYVIEAMYSAMDGPLKSVTTTFRVFLFLVLLLWLLALVQELREMIKLAEFCIAFPRANKAKGLGVQNKVNDDGESKIHITGISHTHRTIISTVCVFRTIVVFYLGAVGCVFLVNDTGYMDLLMNAVALAFILEIDEILFSAVSRGSTLMIMEEIQPMVFKSMIPPTGCLNWIMQKDFIALLVMPIMCILLIWIHDEFTTEPVLGALNCACYQTGEKCIEAQTYNKAWWTNYWSVTLPSALNSITAGAAPSTPAP